MTKNLNSPSYYQVIGLKHEYKYSNIANVEITACAAEVYAYSYEDAEYAAKMLGMIDPIVLYKVRNLVMVTLKRNKKG